MNTISTPIGATKPRHHVPDHRPGLTQAKLLPHALAIQAPGDEDDRAEAGERQQEFAGELVRAGPKMLLPRTLTSAHTLNDSSAAIPSAQVAIPATMVDATRFSGAFLHELDHRASSEIDEVSAAKINSAKNITPRIMPPEMLPKPAAGDEQAPGRPRDRGRCEHDRKIARPAPSAITVSAIATVRAAQQIDLLAGSRRPSSRPCPARG